MLSGELVWFVTWPRDKAKWEWFLACDFRIRWAQGETLTHTCMRLYILIKAYLREERDRKIS